MNVNTDYRNHEFTPDGYARAEKYVERLLEKSVQKIRELSNPVSIYLQGSFGRGEGTVLFNEEGTPRLWRDLDIVVIYRIKESPEILSKIKQELNEMEGINRKDTPVNSSYISIAQLPLPIVLRWRDLKMYELSTNSLHLFGKDIRPKMSVGDGKIPFESGERFLLQKCMGLCKAYPFIETNPSISNYEVSKTYIEISSALSLDEGEPSADFQDRIKTIRNSNYSAISELAPRIEEWGQYKIQGEFEELAKLPPRRSWENARDDLLRALAIYLDSYEAPLSRNPEKWLEGYYQDLSSRFLSNTFSSAIASDWPPGPITNFIGKLGSLAYKAYSSVTIAKKRPGWLACPLSAVYTASIAGLTTIGTDNWNTNGVESVRYYLKIAGETLENEDPDGWIEELDDAYQRASKPLYGMG